MTAPATNTPSRPGPMSQSELIALMAMLSATVAFSIDAMLPALPQIGAALSPLAPENAHLVITSFVFGMGAGTLIAGPLSDALGRKPVMLTGAAIYILGAVAAALSQSLEIMLAARIVQGLGASGPRVVAIAVIRDLYGGREMARLVSFVMIVFTLVPVLAPTLGAGLAALVGWQGIFGAFVVFALITAAWVALRLPETLAEAERRPFRPAALWAGLREMWGIEMVRLSILVQTLSFGMLFAMLSSTQLVFDQTFGQGETFHLWFGGIALVAGTSGFLNASIVRRFGMRPIIMVMLGASALLSVVFAGLWMLGLPGQWPLALFVLWQVVIFFQAGMTIGNLNALAMEPLGHMAGLAASVMGAVSTIGAALIGAGLGALFDGTPLPLALGLAALALTGFALTLRMRQLDRVTG